MRLFGGGVVFEGLSLLFWIVFVCSMSGSEALMCCLMCNARAVSRVTRHTSHVTRHASRITRHTSHVTRHTSRITRHTSHVTRHTSIVTRHTSHVTRHTSHVTHHTSHVTRHTSHVARHTSHVTRHTSLVLFEAFVLGFGFWICFVYIDEYLILSVFYCVGGVVFVVCCLGFKV